MSDSQGTPVYNMGARISRWVGRAIHQSGSPHETGFDVVRHGQLVQHGNTAQVVLEYLVVVSIPHPVPKGPDGQTHRPLLAGFGVTAAQTRDKRWIAAQAARAATALAVQHKMIIDGMRTGGPGSFPPSRDGTPHPN